MSYCFIPNLYLKEKTVWWLSSAQTPSRFNFYGGASAEP